MQLRAYHAWTFAHNKLAYKQIVLPSGNLHLRTQAIGIGRRAPVRRSRVLTVTTLAFKTQTDAPTYKDAFPEPMEYAAVSSLKHIQLPPAAAVAALWVPYKAMLVGGCSPSLQWLGSASLLPEGY